MSHRKLAVGVGFALVLGCGGAGPAPAPTAECLPKQVECRGQERWRCARGEWRLDEDCGARGQFCMVPGEDDEGPGPHFSGTCSPIQAACPFVDVWTGAEWVTAGEILRNLNRRDLYGAQSLALPADAVRDGALVVRLAERKDEVTELDAIWLEVDGERIAPVACAGDDCAADGTMVALRRGEVREYRFEVPEGGAPLLWAQGYYVPGG